MISNIFILIVLILLNAFFAAVEMAFVSLNDNKIALKAKEKDKKAIIIEKMLKNPSKFLATIQIGITLAGFLSSAFAAETFADMLAPKIYKIIPFINLNTWKSISIIIVTIILSYFTLVFGELVPKRIAMKYSEKIAYASCPIIKVISIITAPFVRFLTVSTNFIAKLFGITEQDEEKITEEEIRMMIDAGEEKGTIEKKEKEIINNVFELNDKFVSEIMIPRIEIFALDMNLSIEQVIQELTEDTRYSRIPVFDETIDEIKGIVHIKDILLYRKDIKNTKIRNIMREVYYVPENKLVNELFDELRKNKRQIAIVLDEYGGTAGMVTMEDILEEIVGEIYDEYDKEQIKYKKIDENTYLIDGNVAIYDVEKILGIQIKEGEYDTLAGYLIDELGYIPKRKERPVIETDNAIYKIEKMKDKKIIEVKVCKNN